ncbi:MAG: DNA/RNA non-specific endonuclease [Lentisphaeria bacterium]|nr:DNA/RNA non-specific endonuclease [Lentisphaeria bacterium]
MLKEVTIFLLLALLLFTTAAGEQESDHLIFGLPSAPDILLNRKGFALGYSHKRKQAVWACYILTAKQLKMPKVRRKNRFAPDPEIRLNPVKPADYRRTGYDRGHLAPAADMSFSKITMTHSFYMSNISPQLPGCNRGIWKRLEEKVRKWALKEEKLCIITGPLFFGTQKVMGKRNIPVPDAFYKIILDMTKPYKMTAYIIPNNATKRRLNTFVVAVDQIEEATGFDFFPDFPGAEEMEKKPNLWE